MNNMFRLAIKFDQDLSNWCVKKTTQYTNPFTGTPMLNITTKHPRWGEECSILGLRNNFVMNVSELPK